METAIKVLSYTLAIIMGIGLFALAADNDLGFYDLFAGLLIEVQCILTLIYINSKK